MEKNLMDMEEKELYKKFFENIGEPKWEKLNLECGIKN